MNDPLAECFDRLKAMDDQIDRLERHIGRLEETGRSMAALVARFAPTDQAMPLLRLFQSVYAGRPFR